MARKTAQPKRTPAKSASRPRPADVRVKIVETEELRLVDRSGRLRAVLGMTPPGPRLAMMHQDGTIALELVLLDDGPAVRLSDEQGETRLFLGATRSAARIGMADGQGSQRLFLGVNTAGQPTISLYDSDQRQVWTTGAKRTRPAD